jgi:hypothetical protein
MLGHLVTEISQEIKVKANRLRRVADRQGLRLVKSRARDPHALDYNLFALIAVRTTGDPAIAGRWMTLDDVEAYLSRPVAND